MKKPAFTLLLVAALLGLGGFAQAQATLEGDLQDFNEVSGTGCVSKKPITEHADFYFVCRSKQSGEHAWDAALYKGKLACEGNNFSVYFNLPPSLPVENLAYGAQVEIRCHTQP